MSSIDSTADAVTVPSSVARTRASAVRQAGISPNHWYAVALSREVQQQPVGITLWKQAIVLYRNSAGTIQALDDRCPHRQVKLSSGKVQGDGLQCAYHGWQFSATGDCVAVPYLAENQQLPTCRIRPYPVQEKDGFIWIFPGDATLADVTARLPLPEWDHLNYIASVATIDCDIHFSYLIENLMDMYHGHLHDDYQAWADAKLRILEETDDRVDAHYDAQSYYTIDKIWSVSQLFIPALRQLHPEPLDVSYVYPHWIATLGQDFKIGCLFCPISETHTKAYLLHFTSLNAFWRLHRLPVWFRRWIKDSLFNSAQGLLNGLIEQDVLMMEQEQQAYLAHPDSRNYELNPALAAVQRLICRQADQS